MNSIFLFLLITFVCQSCADKQTNSSLNNGLKEIHLKELESNRITEEDVLKSIHFIKLETSVDYLIDRIEQLDFFDGHFFILDGNENLFMFNEQGKFVRKIGNKGPGPDDYVGATMFYIHPKKKYVSLFRGDMAAVRYDFDGNYIGRLNLDIKSNILTDQCYLIDAGHILLENSNSKRLSPYHYVCVSENEMKEVNRYFLMPTLAEENCAIGQFRMNNNVGNQFYAITLYNDTIYRWEEKRFIPKYILNSSLKHPNPKEIKANEPYEFIGDVENILNQNSFSPGPQKLFSTDEYLCLEYFGLGYFDLILLNKEQATGYLYRFSSSDNPLLHMYNNLLATSTSCLIRYMSVDMLYFAEKEIKACNHPEVPNLYKMLKEDDNPVILMYDYDKLLSRFK